MDTQKIATQFRLSNWGELVKERIASGQSVGAFCEENGIGISTYYYRQRKAREAVWPIIGAFTSASKMWYTESMAVPRFLYSLKCGYCNQNQRR